MPIPDYINKVIYYGHPEWHKGTIRIGQNSSIYHHFPGCVRIELTGDVTIGDDCMVGAYTRIYTHDHYHGGRDKTMFQIMYQKVEGAGCGVKWSNLVIGNDVWIHGATILEQVTEIPDGVVLGTDAVLTKNPRPYEIWAGNPARKVGER